MEFGVCLLSIIPVRREPADISEMVTQIQFGELVTINQKHDNWLHVRNVFDSYEGWIDEKQIEVIDEQEFNRLNKIAPAYSTDLAEIVLDKYNKVAIPVLFGSVLYGLQMRSSRLPGDYFSLAAR